MPTYEYECQTCGSFTMLRPMAQRHESCQCPSCAGPGGRLLLSAPALTTLSSSQRQAMATNERSAHAPQTLGEYQQNRRHPSGCSCCTPSKPLAPTKENPQGLKRKTGSRPWMISH
ncbi:putative regulatory protein, FmdB family [Pseudomonas sp. NFIX10]|uniref:FmdB family zinc ribbon protein n=1 Tax=Pseudomonas TaxID=286 RepID=UPI0008716CF9|nr:MULTISPECIES: zinc ribbon domain-containing protein [unclassified Pseudomonas]SCW55538.1 putative regulatory protein, FmdB family [Pseudomonas sp. NFACC56-3]SFB03425.1 putative regulatory protein, FmdB family [Pseudomonas sp. NFIX10]SFE59012.1 putative regulatory protein, FmdB family [Pseudomonas sp. NFACC06-1]SFK29770.1 putative regulatory protein, FmdB family [Pseudomonas sp. NFACC52]